MSHNAPLCSRNVYTFLLESGALWDICLMHWWICETPLLGYHQAHHWWLQNYYTEVIMSLMASHITSLTTVYSIFYSDADQRKHQSSASLAFVWGIHRGPVNSPHKWPVTRKMLPFDDVIMYTSFLHHYTVYRWLSVTLMAGPDDVIPSDWRYVT